MAESAEKSLHVQLARTKELFDQAYLLVYDTTEEFTLGEIESPLAELKKIAAKHRTLLPPKYLEEFARDLKSVLQRVFE